MNFYHDDFVFNATPFLIAFASGPDRMAVEVARRVDHRQFDPVSPQRKAPRLRVEGDSVDSTTLQIGAELS